MNIPPDPANGQPTAGPKDVALVLGSGAMKCAAAVGMRRVLEREGIPVHFLIGCSGGSLYAGAHAADEVLPYLKRVLNAAPVA